MIYTATTRLTHQPRHRLTRYDWAWIRLFFGVVLVLCTVLAVYVIAPAMGVNDRPVHLEIHTAPQTVPPPSIGTLP